MTFSPVRLDTTSIYFWMLGATLTLLGVAFTVLPEATGTDLVALGSLFMISGLIIPVVVGVGVTVQDLWEQRAESNGGDSA